MTGLFEIVEADTPQLLKISFDIRHEVFVVEQSVPETVERDEWDRPNAVTRHFLVLKNDSPVGTARVLHPYNGQKTVAKVQRVAVLMRERGLGAGKALMCGVHAAYPSVEAFVLGAQITAMGLYKSVGYVAEGEEYMDAGIRHRDMRWRRTLAQPTCF